MYGLQNCIVRYSLPTLSCICNTRNPILSGEKYDLNSNTPKTNGIIEKSFENNILTVLQTFIDRIEATINLNNCIGRRRQIRTAVQCVKYYKSWEKTNKIVDFIENAAPGALYIIRNVRGIIDILIRRYSYE